MTKYEKYTDETITINKAYYNDLRNKERMLDSESSHTVDALKLLRDNIAKESRFSYQYFALNEYNQGLLEGLKIGIKLIDDMIEEDYDE
jgi:hypothetical protein